MKITSFDIFDTCLVRTCGTPENFFDVLAYKVFDDEVDDLTRSNFIIARRKAERKLLGNNFFYDIFTIYDNFDYSHNNLADAKRLPYIEMDLEKELLRPVLETKRLVEKERSKGRQIIFISDMYLHSDFLIPILEQFGFYKEGDKIYISNEKGKIKYGGGLYRLIQNELNVPFKRWKHFGDNNDCDYDAARELGIKANRLVWQYQQYRLKWKEGDSSINYKYASIAAGISRALYYSEPDNSHKNFILDLIAPFDCSYTYKVLNDAHNRGLKRLFFCARDAFQLFHIAKQLSVLFPDIEIKYLNISRDALYNSNKETILGYLIQEGVASKNSQCALVDSTTSGKTIMHINDILTNNGWSTVLGYYYLYWDDDGRNIQINPQYFHFEIKESNIHQNSKYSHLFILRNNCFFENFFSLNTELHTNKIIEKDGHFIPVFDKDNNEDSRQEDQEKWSVIHQQTIKKYTTELLNTKLYLYSDQLFNLSINTLLDFFRFPEKQYLPALLSFKLFYSEKPVIKKSGIVNILLNRGKDSEWPLATILYNLPYLFSLLIKNRYRNKNIF